MELVSIIIPVYNVYNYLSKCIDSVISQTYPAIEIILVDDGSTDNSDKICDKYAKQDKRIRVIHQKNKGLSEARNVGLKYANGRYIFFVDSDDYILENTIKDMIVNQKENNADIVICNFKYMNSATKEESNVLKRSYFGWDTCTFWSYYFRSQYSFIFTIAWNKLYKKQLFNDISFPVGKLNEDDYLANTLFFKKLKINYVNEKLYVYRQRKNSIMHSQNNIDNYDGIYAIINRTKLFAQRGQYDFVRLCLNHALGLISSKLRNNCLKKNEDYLTVLSAINKEILTYPNVKLLLKLLLIQNIPSLYLKLSDVFHNFK